MWPAVIFHCIIVSCVAKRAYLAGITSVIRSLRKALECVVRMQYITFPCAAFLAVNCGNVTGGLRCGSVAARLL